MLLEGTTWQEVLAFREQMEFSILRCAFLHITEQDLSALSQNLEKNALDLIPSMSREISAS